VPIAAQAMQPDKPIKDRSRLNPATEIPFR